MAINVLNNRTGGPARQMYALREAMVAQGHQVDLVFSDDIVQVCGRVGLSPLLFPLAVLEVFRRLARARGPYDVVTFHTLAGAGYVWCRRWWRGLPPCVIVSHGADELHWRLEVEEARLGSHPLGWRARWLYHPLVVGQARYATRHADHVITMVTGEKQFYVTEYGRRPETISVIPNGVSPEFFHTRSYAHAPRRILYLGGWEWRKGIRELVSAFTQVAAHHPEVTLSVVGTGDAHVLEDFPVTVQARVHLTPRIDAPEVPALYAAHDLFVLPTLFESIPLVIPEAMASGMPIVTTAVCGLPDILEDGTTAFLIPPRRADLLTDRIGQLLNDPPLCERLGRAAQRKAQELTWDRIAAQTLAAYERLLQARS